MDKKQTRLVYKVILVISILSHGCLDYNSELATSVHDDCFNKNNIINRDAGILSNDAGTNG